MRSAGLENTTTAMMVTREQRCTWRHGTLRRATTTAPSIITILPIHLYGTEQRNIRMTVVVTNGDRSEETADGIIMGTKAAARESGRKCGFRTISSSSIRTEYGDNDMRAS